MIAIGHKKVIMRTSLGGRKKYGDLDTDNAVKTVNAVWKKSLNM